MAWLQHELAAVYEEVSNAQGTVLCTTPHLGYCEDGARRYEPGKCVITQSLQTIATPFSVALHVEVDGIRSSNVASFTYTAVPSIDYIYPASGPSYASIVLVGNRLEQGTDYVARFGDILMPARYQDGSCEANSCRVLTEAPGGSVGTVLPVELALNGQQFTSSGSTFTYTDVDECSPSPCLNGGSCLESSVDPDIPLEQYSCTCVDGWEGAECQVDTDECASVPCQHGATCVDSQDSALVAIAGYNCTCAAGWTNTHCDEDIDECLSNPCHNGAACLESSIEPSVPAGHFSCSCGPLLARVTK